MNIAFYSDDSSALHAALLANYAFNRPSDHPVPSDPSIAPQTGAAVRFLPDQLDAASETGSDLIVALPLRRLGEASIRSRLDLAVVTCGAETSAAKGALRAISLDAERTSGEFPRPWLFSCRRVEWPTGVRVLPVGMGAARGSHTGRLGPGGPAGATVRQALGLGAALLYAAEDPDAAALMPDQFLNLLQGQTTARGLALRARLLRLATDLDEPNPTSDAGAQRSRHGRPSMPHGPSYRAREPLRRHLGDRRPDPTASMPEGSAPPLVVQS